MALSFFGFTCDPVRGSDFEHPLVLIRIEGCVSTKFYADAYERSLRRHRAASRSRLPYLPPPLYRCTRDASFTFGIVVLRQDAAQACLDLVRRGVKPWADPRRRRAA